jgi:hypothetical protein
MMDTADGLAGMFGVLDHVANGDDRDDAELTEKVWAMWPWLRLTSAALADSLRGLNDDLIDIEANVLKNPVVADGGAR